MGLQLILECWRESPIPLRLRFTGPELHISSPEQILCYGFGYYLTPKPETRNMMAQRECPRIRVELGCHFVAFEVSQIGSLQWCRGARNWPTPNEKGN